MVCYRTSTTVLVCALILSITALANEKPAAQTKADPAVYEKAVRPFVKKYCLDCHGGKKPQGGVILDKSTLQSIAGADRRRWQKALEMLEFGAMPPEDAPQPPKSASRQVAKWLESALYYIDCDKAQDPGRVTIQRLNRSEYDNTIRDLFGVKNLKPARDFPSDDVGSGFDNIGDVLSISPLLLEKYMDAAEKIAGKVVDADASVPLWMRQSGSKLGTAGGVRPGQLGWLSLFSTGEAWGTFEFPRDGEYTIQIEAAAAQAGPETARMEFRLDKKRVGQTEVKASVLRPKLYRLKVRVKKGKHRVAGAFVNDYYNPKAKDRNNRDRNLYIRSIQVAAPVRSVKSLPESHRRLIPFRPLPKALTVEQAATKNLQAFLPLAFRRPLRAGEVERFVGLVKLAVERGETFERGMQVALTAVLVSPHFLFRVERDSSPADPGKKHALTDYELACRLSYFLWSSMPDADLTQLAAKQQLNDPAVLRKQVKRMLRDPKSIALVDNFAGQWLNLRILDEVSPDPKKYPGFSRIRADMRRETSLFFAHVMRKDRSILDFIGGRYSFLNNSLARHYGIKGIRGRRFRRVAFGPEPRAGILTHGSILTLTSNPNRTSPVKRGKWIMENILGSPPPDPPANVPELIETAKANPNASLREQLEVHRKSAACATCHRQMDALGFGFENYDAVGRWREEERKKKIDASGSLPGGESFNGPLELVRILKGKDRQFARLMAQKMLTYALGRGLEHYDRCTTDEVVKKLAEKQYRFSELVTQIVLSRSFRMRRGEEPKDE